MSAPWPYCVVPGYNVRKPDGYLVFSRSVDKTTAQEARDALNERWDDDAP